MGACRAEFPSFESDFPGPKSKSAKGKKRKAEPAPLDAKSRLSHGMCLLNGGPVPKGGISYEVAKGPGGLVGTVSISTISQSFQGAPAKDKKEAESAAAEAALESMKDQLEAAEAEHQAKKKAKLEPKKQEFLAKVKAKAEA